MPDPSPTPAPDARNVDASRGAQLASVCACLLVAAWAGCYRIRTYDTMFHIATGKYILAHGAVAHADPFSYTHPGAPWRNPAWGFQVVAAALHDAFGFVGLSVYQAAVSIVLAGCCLFAVRAHRRLLPVAALLFAAVLVGFREVLEARPHALAYVCLSATLMLVLELHTRPRWSLVAGLAAVHAVWASVHGSHLLAFVIVGLGLFAHAFGARRARAVWFITLACVGLLSLLLAPEAFVQGPEHVGSEFLASSISEWYPVRLSELFEFWPGRVFLACWLLTLLGVVAARSHPDTAATDLPRGRYPLLLLVFFAVMALSSRRMIGVFLFGAAPLWLPYTAYLVARAWRGLVASPGRNARLATVVMSCGWLACIVALVLPGGRFDSGVGLSERRFPVRAVDAIEGAGRIRRIYNAYNFGGYLILRGVPKGGVFVDGRAITVYPVEFLEAIERAADDPRLFDVLARRYAVDGVLLDAQSRRAPRLRRHLTASGAWRLTHQDPIAEVYEPTAVR
jgi:hypothetical protein